MMRQHKRQYHKRQSTSSDKMSVPSGDSIFCDGACSANGTARAEAGWAWAYWRGEVSGQPQASGAARLDGGPATNQRAELRALLESLRWWASAGGGRPVSVYTDSVYAMNCANKWGPSWRRKGWTRDSGEPIQNLDLIKPLVEIWQPAWALHHVRGHQTGGGPFAHGNNWVDRAAVAAIGTGSAGGGAGAGFSMASLLPDLEATLRGPLDLPPEEESMSPAPERVRLPPIGLPSRALQQSDIRSWFAAQTNK
jgi:ribonuclease HI